jgi:hypothetical protein
MSLYDQRWMICHQSISVRAIAGRRATLFRAPYGAWSSTTMWAARSCGLKYVVQWDTVVDHGNISYARGGLQPGSIVLLHLRPDFELDLQVTLAATRQAGLTPALLTDTCAERRPRWDSREGHLRRGRCIPYRCRMAFTASRRPDSAVQWLDADALPARSVCRAFPGHLRPE